MDARAMRLCSTYPLLAAVLLLVVTAGCGDDGQLRYRVTGTVTYQGTPVPTGLVMFDPDTSQGNDGPQGFAVIRDGYFDTSADGGKGPTSGPHRVRVSGYNGSDRDETQPYGNRLFAEYVVDENLPEGDHEMTIVVGK